MGKKTLESALGAGLVAQGFKKKALSWYRQAEGALQIVDLQKSAYGLQFYLNLCCVPAGMEVEGMPAPKEHKCPIRIRLTAAFPEHRNKIEEENTKRQAIQREKHLQKTSGSFILGPWLRRDFLPILWHR